MESNIFSKNDLAAFVEMPADLSDKRLDPHIREVERFRLAPALASFPGLLAAVRARRVLIAADVLARAEAAANNADAPAPLAASIVDELLEPITALVGYASLARYWPFSQSKLTKNGNVSKGVDQSEQISSSTLNRQVAVFQQSAQSYEGELADKLAEHAVALGALLSMTSAGAGCEVPARRRSSPVAHLSIRRDRGDFDRRRPLGGKLPGGDTFPLS